MKSSPLQLDSCYFTLVRVATNPNCDGKDSDKVKVDVTVETGPLQQDERKWYAQIRVKLSPQENSKPPYGGEVEVVGSFVVSPDWPSEKTEKLVYINGLGMLYAAARELICTITARGFYRMYSLPSISFSSMYLEKEEVAKQSAAVKEQPTE